MIIDATDLSNISTYQLVEELKKREGVAITYVEPYKDVELVVNENLEYSVDGPAVILIVND